MQKLNVANLEELERLENLDLGDSSKKNIYPKIQFSVEEVERLERFSSRVGFKKGTIVQVAVKDFLRKLQSGEIK